MELYLHAVFLMHGFFSLFSCQNLYFPQAIDAAVHLLLLHDGRKVLVRLQKGFGDYLLFLFQFRRHFQDENFADRYFRTCSAWRSSVVAASMVLKKKRIFKRLWGR